jgi:hypothetical protein
MAANEWKRLSGYLAVAAAVAGFIGWLLKTPKW